MAAAWRFEARIDATPDAVYAWMSDYRDDDHANERFRRGAKAADGGEASHRVVERRDAKNLVVRDEWGRQQFTLEVQLVPEERETRLRGEWGYRSTWRAESDGNGGTKLTVDGELAPRGPMRLLAPLFAARMRRQMEQDFAGHVEDLRATLSRPSA
jgi:hypothetical protein